MVMIAATAPAVRLGISEEFGLEVGTNSERKMVSALREAGFDYVFGAHPPEANAVHALLLSARETILGCQGPRR